MKILKNKGFLSIGITFILVLILGNYFISYRIIFNKNKRVQSIFKRKDETDIFYNIKIFSFDEICRIDKEISSMKYKNPVEFLVKTKDNSKLWLEKSSVISENGYVIYRIFLNEKLFYRLNQGEDFDFFNFMKKEVERNRMTKNFIIEVIKKYQIENFKTVVVFKGIIQLIYRRNNFNIFFPDKEELKELVIKIDNE